MITSEVVLLGGARTGSSEPPCQILTSLIWRMR